MLSKLKPKSEFSRNVLTLMTGTSIAQAIPIALTPILTRIYTPEDFGTFALFLSLISIISVAATGRYEVAIILPKHDIDARNIVVLSILIAFIFSVILLLLILVFKHEIILVLDNEKIAIWLYWIPLSVILTGIYQSINYWLNRKQMYSDLSKNRVIKSSVTSAAHISIGMNGFGIGGLVLGTIIGQVIATWALVNSMYKQEKFFFHSINKLRIISLLKKYIEFPKYDLFATISNVAAQNIMHIFFNIFFTSTVAGYYYLSQKMIGIPVTVVGTAILDVFKQKATDEFNKFGNAKVIYLSTIKKLFYLSFIPTIIIFIFAVDIFTLLFGKEWIIAGEYAQILTPMLLFRFIASPLSFMFYIAKKQLWNVIGQFSLFLLVVFSFLIGDYYNDAKLVVILLSTVFSVFYLVYILLSARLAKVI